MSNNFKATILWNDVIKDFRTCMTVKRHRYKLMSYQNTFTGKEASLFLFSHLQKSESFGPDISRKQVDMLLDKFLKAGVFENVGDKSSNTFRPKKLYRFKLELPIQDTLLPSSDVGKERSKSQFEALQKQLKQGIVNHSFADNGDRRQLTPVGNGSKNSCPSSEMSSSSADASELYWIMWNKKEMWKSKVLIRVRELLGYQVHLEEIFDIGSLPSIWLSVNASSLQAAYIRHAGLPTWVNESLCSLGYYNSAKGECETYDGYFKDIAFLLNDFLVCGEDPLSPTFKRLLIRSFFYLNELNRSQKLAVEANEIKELLWSRSASGNTENQCVKNESGAHCVNPDVQDAQNYLWKLATPRRLAVQKRRPMTCNVNSCAPNTSSTLPQGLCYETAFTSDEPVTRVVRKSCTDTLTLKTTDSDLAQSQKFFMNSRSFKSTDHLSCAPSRFNGEFAYSSESPSDLESVAFSDIVRPESEKASSLSKAFSEKCLLRPESRIYSQQIRAKSNDHYNGDLNYHEAISCVEQLIDLSKSTQKLNDYDYAEQASCDMSIDSGSAYSYSACSSLSTEQSEEYRRPAVNDNSIKFWNTEVKFIATHLFRLELLFLPPLQKVRFEVCLFLLELLKKMNEDTTKLFDAVLDSIVHYKIDKDGYLACNEVLEFMVENRREVTRPFAMDQICGGVAITFFQDMKNVQPRQFKSGSYCIKITNEDFQEQRVTGSNIALGELLQQILTDGKMPEKEKKKRLKRFREAYPHIYNRMKVGEDPHNPRVSPTKQMRV